MKQTRSKSGIALVVVLVFLVLLSVFVVGFFSNSQDELSAAQSFTGEVTAQHLSESAVAVIEGQIREATSRTNGAWGSQPGMIRVYRSGDQPSNAADAFFKLYSSNDMILSGGEIDSWNPATEVPEGAHGWNHQPAAWTDLNEPVRVILNSDNGVLTQGARYPILDPSLDGKVEGLEFLTTPLADSESAAAPARMPVRWLYVLRDGTLTAPSGISGDGLEATWKSGQRAPSAANPIVGRIAFWTDDETSKVNVNTAGGYSLKEVQNGLHDRAGNTYTEDNYAGSFWDAPHAYTKFDRGFANQTTGDMDQPSLALSQPVRGEFQRYPGHPSTTSLGILFRDRKAGSGASMQDAPYLLTSGQLALLSPRLQYSADTTDRTDRGSNYGIDRLVAAYDAPPGLRVKRLYATVDELFFSQPTVSLPASSPRVQSDVALGISSANDAWKVVSPDLLEKMRFFLTAYSRAPELNLFGRPRMTLWPVRQVNEYKQESDFWNASDRLIAFCSTIGPDSTQVGESQVARFLLQRQDWSSPTTDSNIARNQTLYGYLQSLTTQPFPGFGGDSFKDKYTKIGDKYDRDQILTEMFDYMRVVNLRDSTRDKSIVPNLKTNSNPDGVSPTTPQFQKMESYRFAPRGLVVPLQFKTNGNTTQGFGRFPTISEAAVVFYHAGYKATDGKRYFLKSQMPKDIRPAANLVRAFLALETFNPMQGFAPITTPSSASIPFNQRPTVIEIDNLDQFAVNKRSLGFPSKNDRAPDNTILARTSYTYSPADFWNGRSLGGSEGFFHTLCKKPVTNVSNNLGSNGNLSGENPALATGALNPEFYALQSIAGHGDLGDILHPGIELSMDQTTMEFSGGNLVLRMKFDSQLISTLNVNFPGTTLPVPNGGQDTAVSDQDPAAPDPAAEMRDLRAYWQSDAGGFVPTYVKGLNPVNSLYACNKEQLNAIGAFTQFPAYAKSFAGRIAWIMSVSSKNAESGRYVTSVYPNPVDRTNKWRQILQPGDVVRSVSVGQSDLRLTCLQSQKPTDTSLFVPHPDYFDVTTTTGINYQACSLRCANGTLYYDGSTASVGGPAATRFGNITPLQPGKYYYGSVAADLPLSTKVTNDTTLYNSTVVKRSDGYPGDFDTGLGNLADGPFCNKADEGNLTFRTELKDANNLSFNPRHWQYTYPYFDWTYGDTFDTFFTPNRQVPSAVLFGSLLAGKKASWQTLCFSPNPAGDNHPGRTGAGPKDYLWLDLFWMPVVEPYAISEPFSTAGKINMNYQIIPFSNIKRSSGLRAAIQPVRVTAYPAADSTIYSGNGLILKYGIPVSGGTSLNLSTPSKNDYRYLVDRDETIKAFDYFFSQFSQDTRSGFFKSAAQICDFYLYPRQGGQPVVKWSAAENAIKAWWKQNTLTGDNIRERPYADLYARLTTKSNTYCVHIRAQSLRQSAPSDLTDPDTHYRTWSEKRDRVIGEYRGASIIERYIDPQDARFAAGAGLSSGDASIESINVDQKPLDTAYRFRVLNTKRFNP